MKVKFLKPGTKLIWDAPRQEVDGDNHMHILYPGRVIYPVLVLDDPEDACQKAIRTPMGDTHINGKQDFLRYPTDKELTLFSWSNL